METLQLIFRESFSAEALQELFMIPPGVFFFHEFSICSMGIFQKLRLEVSQHFFMIISRRRFLRNPQNFAFGNPAGIRSGNPSEISSKNLPEVFF